MSPASSSPRPPLLPSFHELSKPHHSLPPRCSASPQPQSNGASRLWAETSGILSQNQDPLLQVVYVKHFGQRDTKLTNTAVPAVENVKGGIVFQNQSSCSLYSILPLLAHSRSHPQNSCGGSGKIQVSITQLVLRSVQPASSQGKLQTGSAWLQKAYT